VVIVCGVVVMLVMLVMLVCGGHGKAPAAWF
jgi:hypothetical protein